MNGLSEVYRNQVRPGIVAFTLKYHPVASPDAPPPVFPHIIGTGLVIREDGLIATNAHVVHAIKTAPRPPDAPRTEWPANVLALWLTDRGMIEVPLEILGVIEISKFEAGSVDYFNKQSPDVAFVRVKAKKLPALVLDTQTRLYEGSDVCTAGFPMGTSALTAPGWVQQMTPTLQKGIVSAVLPFDSEHPIAYSINVMVQGGASGSPVFLPESGEVIGILHSRLYEKVLVQNDKIALVYSMPTNISFVCPSPYIANMLSQIPDKIPLPDLPTDTQSIDEMLAGGELVDATKEPRRWAVK